MQKPSKVKVTTNIWWSIPWIENEIKMTQYSWMKLNHLGWNFNRSVTIFERIWCKLNIFIIRKIKCISRLFRLWVRWKREIEFKGKNFFLYFLRFSTTKTTQKRPSSSRIAVLLQLDSEQLGPIIIVLSYSSSLLIETFCIASQNFKTILAGRTVSTLALRSIWSMTGFLASSIWKNVDIFTYNAS